MDVGRELYISLQSALDDADDDNDCATNIFPNTPYLHLLKRFLARHQQTSINITIMLHCLHFLRASRRGRQ